MWCLTDTDGRSSSYVSIAEIEDPLVIVNFSIWTDLESLKNYVYRGNHSDFFRRKRHWFEPTKEASTVCWLVSSGEIPNVEEA